MRLRVKVLVGLCGAGVVGAIALLSGGGSSVQASVDAESVEAVAGSSGDDVQMSSLPVDLSTSGPVWTEITEAAPIEMHGPGQ